MNTQFSKKFAIFIYLLLTLSATATAAGFGDDLNDTCFFNCFTRASSIGNAMQDLLLTGILTSIVYALYTLPFTILIGYFTPRNKIIHVFSILFLAGVVISFLNEAKISVRIFFAVYFFTLPTAIIGFYASGLFNNLRKHHQDLKSAAVISINFIKPFIAMGLILMLMPLLMGTINPIRWFHISYGNTVLLIIGSLILFTIFLACTGIAILLTKKLKVPTPKPTTPSKKDYLPWTIIIALTILTLLIPIKIQTIFDIFS